MRKLMIVVLPLFLTGCCCFSSSKPSVLTDSEFQYIIPANTPFKAIITDGGKPVDVQRATSSVVIDKSSLIKLQEQANSCTLNK